MDCSLPGSSIPGIFQARVLEWVAVSFSRGSSQPRDQTQVSSIAGRHFTIWATREDLIVKSHLYPQIVKAEPQAHRIHTIFCFPTHLQLPSHLLSGWFPWPSGTSLEAVLSSRQMTISFFWLTISSSVEPSLSVTVCGFEDTPCPWIDMDHRLAQWLCPGSLCRDPQSR